MKVIRNYNHKAHGAIGVATLEGPDGEWTLDGKVLPESSVSHLVNFALQTLQDAYAGAKNEAEAVAAFEAKRDRLVAGTLGTRGGGDGASERTLTERSVTRAAMKDVWGKDSKEWAEFTGLSDADQIAKLDANYAANESQLSDAVQAKIDAKIAARAAKAKAAKSVTFKL